MRFVVLLCFLASTISAQTSTELFRRGHTHYDADRTDSATYYYAAALSIDSADVRLQAYTSLIKVAVNRTDHAAADSLMAIADRLLQKDVQSTTSHLYERMKGTAWSRNGRYRNALDVLHRVAEAQAKADEPDAAQTLIDIALTYKRMHLPDSAVIFADRAHDLYRRTLGPEDIKLGYFYDQIGAVYYEAGRLAEAKDYYQNGIDILRRHGETDSEQISLLFNNLANVLTDEGDYAGAFDLRDRALKISQALGQQENYGIGLFNLGVSHYMVGNFGAASQYVEQSIRIREQLVGEGHPSLANSYQARSILQSLSGDDRAAIHSYRQLIDRTRHHLDRDNTVIGGYFDEIGLSYFNLGKLDSAIYHHERAVQIFRTHSRSGSQPMATSLYNLAAALAEAGRYPEALSRIAEAEEILARLGYGAGNLYGSVLGSYAMRLAETGQPAEARRRIDQALSIIRPEGQYSLGSGTADALSLLATAAYTLFTIDPSEDHLRLYRELERDFVETTEHTRLQFYDPYTKGLLNDRAESFLRENISRYYSLYARTGDQDYLQRLFELSEYGKATALRDQLRVGISSYRGVPDSVIASLRNHQQEIESLYYAQRDTPQEEWDSLEARLFTARRSLDTLRLRITRQYPEFAELFAPPNYASAGEELSLLPDQTALVYLLGSEGYYGLVVKPGELTAFQCGTPAEIDTLVQVWRTAVSSVLTRDHLATGHRLYEKLWAPALLHQLGSRVLIVPDGAIHSVAFDALSRSPSAPDYLLKEYSISYAYSLSLLRRQSGDRAQNHTTDLLTVAPGFLGETMSNLDTTRTQVYRTSSQPFSFNLASRMLRDYRGQTLLGIDATESRVRRAIGMANVLFFATHGHLDESAPLQSGIQLMMEADTGTTNGFLSVAEVFNSIIPADLSILGTCASGLGKLTPGEGMLSVAYAFSYAGCASTVNTLWPVDDRANAELIEGFVARLADGQGRAEALRSAKLSYLASNGNELNHPFYWAALALQGRDGPVLVNRKRSVIWWMVIAGGLFLVSLPLLRRLST